MQHKDKIPGGLSDKKKPSDFDKKKLKVGIKIEMEHTNDRAIATEIAMDHLTEDLNYYDKLKTIEKQDRIEITADGKQELDVGKEPLDKLKGRWNSLKKALDSNKAIMEIAGQEYNPDEDESLQQDSQQPPAPQEQEEQPQEADAQQSEGDEEQQSEVSDDEIEAGLREHGYSDAEIAHILHGHILPEATVDDHKAKNEQVEGQINQSNMVEDSKIEREHKKRMQDLEHEKAKSEIADPEVEKNHRKRTLDLEHEAQKKKTEREAMENDHRKQLQQLELDAKRKELNKQDPAAAAKARQAEMEVEHKKRMMDLEYEKAKKESDKEDPTEAMKTKQLEFELHLKRLEKELELKFKEKELALKLKLTEEAAKQKHEHAQQQAESDAIVNAQVKEHQAKHKINEAKKPPVKDKSDDNRK